VDPRGQDPAGGAPGAGGGKGAGGGDWEKTYPLELPRTGIHTFAEKYTLNMEEIEDIVETIGEETGSRV
jgi:hypothetical protein